MFDMICLSETFLGPSISDDDNRVTLTGTYLISANSPQNVKNYDGKKLSLGIIVYWHDMSDNHMSIISFSFSKIFNSYNHSLTFITFTYNR